MKAIIFDMDGVIIDSEPLHCKLEREILKELGGKITEEEHNAFIGTTDYHMWSILKEKFNIKKPVDEIIQMKKERFIKNIHMLNLVDNVEEFIEKLHKKGYPMGLASSNNRKIVNLIVNKFKLDKYFNVIISGEDVSKGKPHPEIFLKTAEKMGVEPHNCLVIEDAKNGVIAAKAAGMKCIGFKNPNSGEQDLSQADLIISSYDELDLNTLKGLFN
ncbi:HAD superfamily hydrolase (TIGR01509 family)/HAD superfamily hydrolase (TIGR01549 family) [Keratinibaculum paraultunense]|uniref:HAD superfamily hydrolase (TIGR01509 family)/HAD superfamily hydrolase (TIGR01549 family) n=1 Tax=Keratinibaculum paraultunense TaxID=1278232 RepID=A0A4V2UUH8_9FIRM|nr:HAD family phosphatase [Keratinibaculum paraultunense]QQY80324.1 HAD family phosphatase [Keratinibaculum paraultunense]TCS90846.1 HAD superfamily hydrolase (TIGR01509 family)/HAD superfamily hydrolase (TIGR01549 family) [Keratinibaculum paraultunense]